MYINQTPRRVASFFERFSSFTQTMLYRYRLNNRCQPIPVRFSGPELVAPHLESAFDEQLQSWFVRPISGATSVSCLTDETSVSGIKPETCSHPHSTVILKEYFENIPLKSCNIAKIFIKLLERFLKYCRNLAISVQNIINGILLQY